MNTNFRNFALWVIIGLLLIALFQLFQSPTERQTSDEIGFSQLLAEVDAGNIRGVTIMGQQITGSFNDGRTFRTFAPNDPGLVDRLNSKGVSITAKPENDDMP